LVYLNDADAEIQVERKQQFFQLYDYVSGFFNFILTSSIFELPLVKYISIGAI